jgi:hypothetical protein
MKTYLSIDADTKAVRISNVSLEKPVLAALFGEEPWEVVISFERDNTPLALTSGTTGKLVAKAPGDQHGEAVLLNQTWTPSGSGIAAVYTFEVDLFVAPLETLLTGKDSVLLNLAIEWTLPGEAPSKTDDLPLTVMNSSSRPDDAAPNPAAAASWEWIKARLVAGANITFSINETTKQITINAAGAEAVTSVAWSEVTGKPSTFPSTWSTVSGKPSEFPPSTHTHSWSQISSGSPSDNAALVTFVQENAGTGKVFDFTLQIPIAAPDAFDGYTLQQPVMVFPRAGTLSHIEVIAEKCLADEVSFVWNASASTQLYQYDEGALEVLDDRVISINEVVGDIHPRNRVFTILNNGNVAFPEGGLLHLLWNVITSATEDRTKLFLRLRGKYTL